MLRSIPSAVSDLTSARIGLEHSHGDAMEKQISGMGGLPNAVGFPASVARLLHTNYVVDARGRGAE